MHHVTLTDVSRRIWHDSFSLTRSPEFNLAGSDDWSVRKHTLRGGLSDGVDIIELCNGRLSLSLVPTRGMGIWRGSCGEIPLGWKSPVVEPVHPAFVDLAARGGIGWLSGFNEWICRCGLDSNGPPGPDGTLHGRIANIPAHKVDVNVDPAGQGTISVTGVIDESSMFGPNLRLTSTVKTAAGSSRFTIIDQITNRRGDKAEVELLYHINTGRPFLEAGARCLVPAVEVAPRDARAAEGIDHYDTFLEPTAGYAEQVYFFELAGNGEHQTVALLRNARGDRGLSVRFDRRELPHFTLWKNTLLESDGYVAGLEPATNFPNLKAFERAQKRVVELAPGETYTMQLEIAIHVSNDEVRQVESEITALAAGRTPQIHRKPRSSWSPG